MTEITLKGNKISTNAQLPKVGEKLENFTLVANDLSEKNLADFKGQLVLNIFPSIDTGTCALSVKTFNNRASEIENTKILCISKDLPFAQKRFCGAEGISNVEILSAFRSSMIKDLGLELVDGPLKGLSARAILVLDQEHKVIYHELVQEVTEEPNYEKALASLNSK